MASKGKRTNQRSTPSRGKGQNSRTGGGASARTPKSSGGDRPTASGKSSSGTKKATSAKNKTATPQPRARRGAAADDAAVADDDTGDGDEPSRPAGGLATLVDRTKLLLTGGMAAASDDDDGDDGSRTRARSEPEYDEEGYRVPRWGLGDVAIGFFLSVFAPLLGYIPLSALGYSPFGIAGVGAAVGQVLGLVDMNQAPAVVKGIADAPLWMQLLFLQVPLWLGLLIPTCWAAWKKGNGFVRDFKLRATWLDVPLGLAIGVGAQLLVIPAVYWAVFKLFGDQDVGAVARQITDKAIDPLSVVLVFVMVGVFAPVVEELYYRGLTLRAAERRFGRGWALAGTSLFFALTHGSLLVLPGILVFGVVLGYLAQRTDRLGPSIFAHVGFNVTTAAVLVFNLNVPWLV